MSVVNILYAIYVGTLPNSRRTVKTPFLEEP